MPQPSNRPGALGALMDEYERVVQEFARLIGSQSPEAFAKLRDEASPDEDCRSILTVTRHVVRSGFGYARYLREALGMPWEAWQGAAQTPQEAQAHLALLMSHTASTLEERQEQAEALLDAPVIRASWGPTCTVEQILEHAIVHVLRHRRQVERFLGGDRG